jgi:hypothetical protein
MDNLAARVVQIRPAYIGKASSAEIEHLAEFIDSLAVLSRHIERNDRGTPVDATTCASILRAESVSGGCSQRPTTQLTHRVSRGMIYLQ